MTNQSITRTLRVKRPQKGIMIDGSYSITAYWDGDSKRSTRVIVVAWGQAYYRGERMDLATEGWLKDHHVPCYCPFPRDNTIS